MVKLTPEHHRGGDLGVRHQVGAVADEADHLAVGRGELDAHARRRSRSPCRNSRTPCGSRPAGRLPELVQLARQAAGGADATVSSVADARCTAPITWASEGSGVGVGGGAAVASATARARRAGLGVQAAGEAQVAERGVELLQRRPRVADERPSAPCLRASKAWTLSADERAARDSRTAPTSRW